MSSVYDSGGLGQDSAITAHPYLKQGHPCGNEDLVHGHQASQSIHDGLTTEVLVIEGFVSL